MKNREIFELMKSEHYFEFMGYFCQDLLVWIGEESSDVEKKLGLKSAQLYQQHVQDLTGIKYFLVFRRIKIYFVV